VRKVQRRFQFSDPFFKRKITDAAQIYFITEIEIRDLERKIHQAKDTMQGFITEVDGFRMEEVLKIYEILLYLHKKIEFAENNASLGGIPKDDDGDGEHYKWIG
jgi:hypothetical protein